MPARTTVMLTHRAAIAARCASRSGARGVRRDIAREFRHGRSNRGWCSGRIVCVAVALVLSLLLVAASADAEVSGAPGADAAVAKLHRSTNLDLRRPSVDGPRRRWTPRRLDPWVGARVTPSRLRAQERAGAPSQLAATDYCSSPSVTQAWTGTGRTIRVSPGQSIQTAVNAAAPGDTVELADGNYGARSVSIAKPVRLKAAHKHGAILEGQATEPSRANAGGTGTGVRISGRGAMVDGLYLRWHSLRSAPGGLVAGRRCVTWRGREPEPAVLAHTSPDQDLLATIRALAPALSALVVPVRNDEPSPKYAGSKHDDPHET
jgi:hypothetical protein